MMFPQLLKRWDGKVSLVISFEKASYPQPRTSIFLTLIILEPAYYRPFMQTSLRDGLILASSISRLMSFLSLHLLFLLHSYGYIHEAPFPLDTPANDSVPRGYFLSPACIPCERKPSPYQLGSYDNMLWNGLAIQAEQTFLVYFLGGMTEISYQYRISPCVTHMLEIPKKNIVWEEILQWTLHGKFARAAWDCMPTLVTAISGL